MAQGQARAGATARAMGLDFDQLNAIIGTVTASTKQSGNEIGNFIKASLPRLVGKPAQSALGSLGINLTDDAGNLRDVIQVYTEVAEKVKGISDSERIAVVEGLAGKYHIARMQILLDDLGSADSMYRNMYNSSVDSAGSAMDENEKFMESLQARINLARVEIEKLALAMGDAFLTEGMITGIQLFGDFLSVVTKFVDKFGVLPALMGTTGVALFLLSTRFKTLAGSVGTSIASLVGFRGAATASATASTLTASAVRGLSVAFKGLLASTGVGLALVGVGVAIEALLGSMGKQREIQEEIDKENRNLTESYSANRNEIQSLSDEYARLEESMKGSKPDTDTQQRYYDVQNKLAELMPNLVKYEDSYGNKILGSGTVIQSKIDLLEKQIQTEERLQQIQNAETDADKQDQSEKDLKSNKALAERMQEEFATKAGGFLTNFAYKEDISNLQDMEKALAHFVSKKKELLDEGKTSETFSVMEVTDTIDDLQRLMDRYNNYSSEMESAQSYLTTKYAENAEKMILDNKDISDSTKDLANSMLYDLSAMTQSSQEAKSISDVFGDGDFQKSLEDATKQIGAFTGSTSENFEKQKKSFLEYAEAMKSSILSDMKGSNGAPLAEDSKAYKNAEQSIDSYVDKLILREQAIRDVMATEGQSREEALLNIQALGDMEGGQESLTDTLSDYVAKLYEKASAEEQVAGVTGNLINEVDNLIFLYNSLSSQTSLTTEQSLALKDAQDKLMAIYPQLNKNGEFRIDSIIAERNAQDILLRAVKASKEGQLTLEEQTTVGHLSETNSRIAIINKEIEASQKLANAYASVYESVVSAAEGGSESAAKLLMRISVPTVKAQMAQAELATLEKSRGGYVNSLSGALDNLDSSTKNSTGSTNAKTAAEKEAAKALETSIYVTDKYKKSMEALSLEIEKQQALREGQPNYSKIYQASLQKEIQLEKNKKKLMEDQVAALEKQIKSGKILQTGIITTSSGGSGGSSSYTGKYSTQINSSASKYGVDPNLIAAIIKQESNFNPNAKSGAGARGLMQLMPSTAKGLGVKNSYDPAQNIEGGTKYIADQIKAFGGDIKKALYAYNAGAGNVSKILASSDKYWKEPKNYANKVLANLASNTGKTNISGWNGNVTSGYGMRNDPFTGKQKMHSGVDIAGKKGDRLDSNVGGKVTFAGKGTGANSGFGNYVAIETANGLKHFYAHLDKVVAKVGDTVAVGSQIGNIGSTGKSTGNHLHYQVNKNGKAIDPTSYLNNAKNTEGSTKEAAQVQQSIDQANSDLINLRSQILATNKEISALEVESIQGYLDGYNRKREDYQHTLDFENAKQEAISQTGSAYRASIDKQITAMNGQQSANQAELKFSEKLIAGGNMSAETMIMLKDRVKALKVEMLQLGAAIEDANFEKINSRMVAFDESQDDLQFLVDLSSEYMSTLTEGSAEYNKAANDQIATMQKQQRMIRTQIDEHTKDLATKKLSVQATKDLREKIEDLTLSYWSLGNGIKSSTESLVEANKKMANEVADKLIETYKDYTQERQDAHMKSIDAEMKAEDKRHKQVSDNLSKELESYRKIIQAKLDMLDKEESERDYNKEIDDLEKDRLDTLNKIALLSLDGSFEAKKETASLTEKLTATEEQIAEKRHDREIELRKENLNNLIESKEEEIKNRQDLEDQRYEHEKELIDKQKEYWEAYYNDLINDERKFAKLREDIIAGNTDTIKAEFGEILTYFNETMPNLENTLDGTMQAVGTSIRQNMIDTLKEALDLMNQIGSNTGSGVSNKVADQFNADKGASTTPDKAQTDAKANQKGLGQITIEKPVNLWKRVGDKLVHDNGRILKAGEKFSVYGRDDKFGGQYNVGGGNWVTDIPGYVKYKKFDTGGYTKNGEGMAMLHEKEIVLNKDDTKNFLKGINILRTLDSLINPLKMSNIKQPELAGASGNGDIVINFNVDKMNANQNEVDTFSKRIADSLKRNKGVR